jgi:hypothetical protein
MNRKRDMTAYEHIRRAITAKTGKMPTHATIMAIMGKMDTVAFDRRAVAHIAPNTPDPSKTDIPAQNRRPAHWVDSRAFRSSVASGSYAVTVTHTGAGGYKGPRAGKIVTGADASPQMPNTRKQRAYRLPAAHRPYGPTR